MALIVSQVTANRDRPSVKEVVGLVGCSSVCTQSK
ncbi:hypothetical protein TcasGA2_TC032267 [Tribolium castaneum]|uniref:Uncharacterized protein n=1 Tax=Tribolium castaneum TaxID=7070 RepID=A0A139WLX2_TRICA|nr:hypothetical protein TcasGA2_TC032267 [Tribolium castaneum]